MINECKKLNNFADLAREFLPKVIVDNFEFEKERENRREAYFTHKAMYDAYVRRAKRAKKKAEEKAKEDAS